MSTADLNTPIAQRIAASLARQGMMTHLDAQLLRVENGEVEVALPFGDKAPNSKADFMAVPLVHWPISRVAMRG